MGEQQELRPTGSSRPRAYGLPKIHKNEVPLRPIISMSGSAVYDISRWLARLLNPVVELFSSRCVKDSFEFVDIRKNADVPSNGIMCSYDVVSLFTNVPLDHTIEIWRQTLYHRDDICPPPLHEDEFVELLPKVTSGVEFSFNNTMYRQCDGVAMGSPLGPVLANIFVGHCESLVPAEEWPCLYNRFVDDCFGYHRDVEECDRFLVTLNSLHPALKFTREMESDGQLPFLDVKVQRGEMFVTRVYRKPTFTGLYIPFDSFVPFRYKRNLIKNLCSRATRLCSPPQLLTEIEFLKGVLTKNGYPPSILRKYLKPNLVSNQRPYGSEKCPVVLRLPYIGPVSRKFEQEIRRCVEPVYTATKVVFVYSTKRAFNLAKDVLPIQQMSNVIYSYTCRQCESRYIGRTLQHLGARIRQHVPLSLLTLSQRTLRPRRGRPPSTRKQTSNECTNDREPPTEQRTNAVQIRRRGRPRKDPPSTQPLPTQPDLAELTKMDPTHFDSAIAKHLAVNPACRASYSDSHFNVLTRGRSLSHLQALESLYIRKLSPSLCVQTKTSTLKLFQVE